MTDNVKGIPFSIEDGHDPTLLAKLCVLQVHNIYGIGTRRGQKIDPLTFEDVHIDWFSYVHGNWKAILSTTRPDGRIYEVVYKRENDGADGPESLVVDSYLKTHNIVMPTA